MSRRAILVTAIAFMLGVVADLFIGYSPIPGYGASIGLFGCIVIIVVSKWIGTAFLERPEASLGDETPPDLHPDLIGDRDHPALHQQRTANRGTSHAPGTGTGTGTGTDTATGTSTGTATNPTGSTGADDGTDASADEGPAHG